MPDGRTVYQISRTEYYSAHYIAANDECEALDIYEDLYNAGEIVPEFLVADNDAEVLDERNLYFKEGERENFLKSIISGRDGTAIE